MIPINPYFMLLITISELKRFIACRTFFLPFSPSRLGIFHPLIFLSMNKKITPLIVLNFKITSFDYNFLYSSRQKFTNTRRVRRRA